MKNLNLVHVPKLDSLPGSPIKSSTAYKWWHLGKNRELFVKFGGKLFLNLDKVEDAIRQGGTIDTKR